MNSGAPDAPAPWVACEPAALRLRGRWIASACASGALDRNPCVWVDAQGGAYLDRTGTIWRLKLTGFPAIDETGHLRGTVHCLRERHSQPGAYALELRIEVGADVEVVANPEPWGTPGAHFE